MQWADVSSRQLDEGEFGDAMVIFK